MDEGQKEKGLAPGQLLLFAVRVTTRCGLVMFVGGVPEVANFAILK